MGCAVILLLKRSGALDRMLEVSIPDEVYEALERQMETEA